MRRPRRARLTQTLREGTGEFVQSVANEVVPGVVDALDVDEVVQRVDIQAILDRVDLTRLIERIDLEVVLERIDIDALLARVDINALLARTELGAVVSRSGSALIGQGLDVVRRQGVDLDTFIERWTNRALRRRAPQTSGTSFVVGGTGMSAR